MKADGHVQLFLGEHELEQADRSLPHGQVCVRTLRSPEKPGSNEDAAAVIQVGDSLVLAVDKANHNVLALARGAATTLVVAQLDVKRLRCYHVGDSELLAVGQRGRIKQRVVPHSPTGFAVEAGLLDENEAVQHDQRHVLFNVIGSPDMRVEVGPTLQLAVHDTVLLASDGLFDNLFIHEIVDAICSGPLVAAANRLVERTQARMRGDSRADLPCKPDDLTVVLFRPRR